MNMTTKLDRATYQTRWTDMLRGYADEAAERWMAAWRQWREQAEALDYAGDPDRLLAEADAQPAPVQWAELSPSVDALVGIDPGWTGELSTDEYIQRQREAPFVPRRPEDVLREAYEKRNPAVLAGPAPDEALPGRPVDDPRYARAWTPLPHKRPTKNRLVKRRLRRGLRQLGETGPRGRYTRAADSWLARAEARLRARFTPVKEDQ